MFRQISVLKKTARPIFLLALLLISAKVFAQVQTLEADKSLILKNNAKTSYSFKIEAAKDKIISLEIKQNGMDIASKLFDSQNSLIAESDNPFSEQDTEKIFVIASKNETYRLELRSKFPDRKGSVNIKLNELTTAAPMDFKRAEAEQLFSQAQILRATGNSADRVKAREIYEKSLSLWREAEDKPNELQTLAILVYLNRVQSKRQTALELAEIVLQSPNQPEYIDYKADTLYQIAQIEFVSGELDKSIETLGKALKILPEKSAKKSNIYTYSGFVYQSNDEFDLAEQAFNQAFENIRRFPDIYNEGQARHLSGAFYFNFNDFETALENFRIAAALREKAGNRRWQAVSITFQAISYQALKDFVKSIELLEQSLAISRELGDRENQYDATVYLARAYRETGRIAEALELYKEADKLWSEFNPPNGLYLSLGVTHTQLGNFSEARAFLEKALLGYRKSGDIGGESLTLYRFARNAFAENKLDEAKTKIEQALQLHEYTQAKYKNLRRLTSFLDTRRRYFDLYIDVLMRLDEQRPNEGFALKALQTSEGARMRTLILQLREALKNSSQTVDLQILIEMQKVQQQIGEQLTLLAKAQGNAEKKETIAPIEKTISDLNKQIESLNARLRLANPNFAALTNPPTLSLAEMQSELDDDTVLIEYSLGEQRSYLWVVGKNSFQYFVLPKRADIDAQARNVYQTLSDSSGSTRTADKKSITKKDFETESAKLGQMLAIDKFANLPVKRLIFVTDGALNSIPFASLSFQNKFLSEKFEIVNLPSLSTLHILRQNSAKPFAPQSLAIFADPVFADSDERIATNNGKKNKSQNSDTDLSATLRDFNLTSLSRLPSSRTEAENITRESGIEVSLNLGFKANRGRILNGEFDDFDILHFATHGFLNSRHPELSGLVLSLVDEKGNQQNGFLRTQDLYLLKLKPQMVVLSACQTGLGKEVENEGLIGLTRGFLANGTPRIVSTLWKVDDAASAALMSRFYRAMLKENKKPPAALQTAQNELRQIPRFSNPRFWAAFVLTGEWR